MNPKILLLEIFSVSLAPAGTMALMGLALISLTFIRVPKRTGHGCAPPLNKGTRLFFGRGARSRARCARVPQKNKK